MGESGPELVIAFVAPSEVEIIDTWYVTGLRATGTQDLQMANVDVPDEMTGLAMMPAPAGRPTYRLVSFRHVQRRLSLGLAELDSDLEGR